MRSKTLTPDDYIASLPEDRKSAMMELRNVIVKNLPKGFAEQMNYGMLGYVVPLSLYPAGYRSDPEQPVPFMNIASQKNFIAVYHMGIYADKNLLGWFVKEYARCSKAKLDMGKACIRFHTIDQIPYQLIGKLAGKITLRKWLAMYEKALKR